MADFPLIVIGAGGHGRVLASALLQTGRRMIGYLDADQRLWGRRLFEMDVIGNDERLAEFSPDSVRLVNGVGSTLLPQQRRRIFEEFKAKGYTFETVVHPQACVSPNVELGEGVQVMAGAVVQVGTRLDSNVIINTGAIIDHDCVIGSHTHVAPGAVLSGGVTIGASCHIGVGAVMMQGVDLGECSLLGAGAVMTHSYTSHARLVGVPAKVMKTK
jgi:sugar O-acyltransferase (sialic acid O-acetyltransferase NeuD family)